VGSFTDSKHEYECTPTKKLRGHYRLMPRGKLTNRSFAILCAAQSWFTATRGVRLWPTSWRGRSSEMQFHFEGGGGRRPSRAIRWSFRLGVKKSPGADEGRDAYGRTTPHVAQVAVGLRITPKLASRVFRGFAWIPNNHEREGAITS